MVLPLSRQIVLRRKEYSMGGISTQLGLIIAIVDRTDALSLLRGQSRGPNMARGGAARLSGGPQSRDHILSIRSHPAQSLSGRKVTKTTRTGGNNTLQLTEAEATEIKVNFGKTS